MITARRAAEIRKNYDAHYAEVNERFPANKSGWRSYPGNTVFANPRPTNEEIGMMEVWEFVNKPIRKGEKYFTYVTDRDTIGTWTALPLMRITCVSRPYFQGYLRDLRRKVYAVDIMGRSWVGSTKDDPHTGIEIGLYINMKYTGVCYASQRDYNPEVDDNEYPFDSTDADGFPLNTSPAAVK